MTGQLLSQPTVGDIRPISGKYRYRCRDVLYSKIRPALVKSHWRRANGYCSADMYPLRCGPKLQPEYLMQILLNRHFTRYALDRATRAQMPKINREPCSLFAFPYPRSISRSHSRATARLYACARAAANGNGDRRTGVSVSAGAVFGEWTRAIAAPAQGERITTANRYDETDDTKATASQYREHLRSLVTCAVKTLPQVRFNKHDPQHFIAICLYGQSAVGE